MLDSLTFVGNLCKDPVLRQTRDGADVVDLRLANTARRLDAATGAYVDGATTFLDVNVWGSTARNAALTLKTGHQVVVIGQLRQRTYEHPSGGTRVVHELRADIVAADLTFQNGTLLRVKRDRPGRGRDDALGLPQETDQPEESDQPEGPVGMEGTPWPTPAELAELDAARDRDEDVELEDIDGSELATV